MSDEYIEKEDAIQSIIAHDLVGGDARGWAEYLLENTSTADVAPIRRGHWIYDQCDIVCSECGTAFNDEVCYMMRSDVSYHEPKHCLWCGARMDGGNDE